MTLAKPSSDETGGPAAARFRISAGLSGTPLIWTAALATAGVIETATLVIVTARHAHVPCAAAARASCAQLFASLGPWGVPLSLWGMAAYAGVLVLALIALGSTGRAVTLARRAGATLATSMAMASAGLMVRMVALGAVCPWCIVSALLCAGLATASWFQESGGLRRTALTLGIMVGAAFLVALQFAPARLASASTDPVSARRLAQHLRASGARLYGVWWCVECREQKEAFGEAAGDLPYVECSRDSAPAWVTQYPAWEIAGQRLIGARSLDTLAARSHFDSRLDPQLGAP